MYTGARVRYRSAAQCSASLQAAGQYDGIECNGNPRHSAAESDPVIIFNQTLNSRGVEAARGGRYRNRALLNANAASEIVCGAPNRGRTGTSSDPLTLVIARLPIRSGTIMSRHATRRHARVTDVTPASRVSRHAMSRCVTTTEDQTTAMQ